MIQLEFAFTAEDPGEIFDAWVFDPQQRRLWRLVAERGIETIRL